jgi:hypothetical protein
MSHPLDILMLTNFSDNCYRAIPAIAQLSDVVKVRLTLLHAFDPRKCSQAEADAHIQSFFPEADRFYASRRFAVAGNLMDVIRQHIEEWPVNLIVAPASDPIGLPSLWDRSYRARFLESFGLPVWTFGRHVDVAKLSKPVQNVACWLDARDSRIDHVRFAIEYASKTDAKLHLLRSIPEIRDGAPPPVTGPGAALNPVDAMEEVLRLCEETSVRRQAHVGFGEDRRSLSKLLKTCSADLVFLRAEESWMDRWLNFGMSWGASIPCPAVYISAKGPARIWDLTPGPALRLQLVRPAESRTSRSTAWASVALP